MKQMFGNNRFLYNYLVRLQGFVYRHQTANSKNHLSAFDMCKLLPKLKRKYPWLKQSDSTALQQTCADVDDAYMRFFRKTGSYPKAKKKSHYGSYTSKGNGGSVRHAGNQLKLPKLGYVGTQVVTIVGHVVSATIKVTPTGHYYAAVLTEQNIDEREKTKRSIGIDLGLRNIMTLSNGVKYRSLRFAELDRQIDLWQRKLARRIKGAKQAVYQDEANKRKFNCVYTGKEYYRNLPWYQRRGVVEARHRLAKLYVKKANRRADYLQKLSTKLVNQYDVIVFEDIRVKNLMHNHRLAKAIGEQGWSMLVEMCEYKSIWYGKQVIRVSPKYTTQRCADCGHVCLNDEHLTLDVKRWACPNCGVIHDRDRNAAINILQAGLKQQND